MITTPKKLTPSQAAVVNRFRETVPDIRVCRRSSSNCAYVHVPVGPAHLIAVVGRKGGTCFEIPNLADVASSEDRALEFAAALATNPSVFASEVAHA